MLYAPASRRPFGISPRAMLANQPSTAQTPPSAPPPPPPYFELEPRPLEKRMFPAPPSDDESRSAGTARKMRKNVFQRGCGAGPGRTTSIGYSPSSPTKPG